jgi:hypothetical protein
VAFRKGARVVDAKCSERNKGGSPCNAAPWRDGLCCWHHPAMRERIAAGRSKGGANRAIAVRARRRGLADLEARVVVLERALGVAGEARA